MAGSSKKVIIAALIGNALIAITKFIAAGITRSSAMLSEGIHSLVDTGNQVLLLYGLRKSKQPADQQYPFGHGQEIYFWSFVVAIMIFAVGAGVSVYEGIQHLLHPQEIGKPFVNYIVLALAMVFEGGAWFYAWRAFNKHREGKGYFRAVHDGKDPTMFVVLFEDSAALLGLMVAFLGVLLTDLTGLTYFDGTASIIIGLILGATAIWLAYETKGLLIGESADPKLVAELKAIAVAHEEVKSVNEILTMHLGPDDILVNISVDFINDVMADQVERVIAEINREYREKYPWVQKIFIEVAERQL